MTKRGLGMIVYGWEGVGKTSFCLQFKKEMLFISIKEQGFLNLEMVGDIPAGCEHDTVDTFEELLTAIRVAKDYSTLVLDSISGIQQLIDAAVLRDHYRTNDKFTAEQQAAMFSEGSRKHAPLYASQICDELTQLNARGVNTLVIGHAKHETVKNPAGSDYNATTIDMESWPRAIFTKWAAAILFITLDLEVMITKTFKGNPVEGKAQQNVLEESNTIMFTSKNPSHSAKNLFHLPAFISMGNSPKQAYENFFKKLPKAIQDDQLA